jgi:hypothetical protein
VAQLKAPKFEVMAGELLRGSIDLHIHTGPDLRNRILDDLEAARQAKAAGMKAILIKSHHTLTSDRAYVASRVVDFPVFGGVALNHYVGGLNVHCVNAAIQLGAKEIWMPTINSSHYLKDATSVPALGAILSKEIEGISVVDADNKCLPLLNPILEAMAEKEVILGTGHLSVQECLTLIDKAANAGVKKILVTHPQAAFVGFTIKDMKSAVEKGAILEHDFVICTHQMRDPVAPRAIAQAITAVGAENCVMATDGGQPTNPAPVEMFRQFIAKTLEHGISEDEIRIMTQENPSKLLGI